MSFSLPCHNWIPAFAGMTGLPQGCAEGLCPSAEGLGVSPNLNSLESLFDKEGLREFGARGLKAHLEMEEFSIGARSGLGSDTHLRALVGEVLRVLEGLHPPYIYFQSNDRIAVQYASRQPQTDRAFVGICSKGLMNQAPTSLRPRHLSGRAEGRSPSALPVIPQEWGIKGVESEP